MKKLLFVGFLCFLYGYKLEAQTTASIRGKIIENTSKKPLKGISVELENTIFLGILLLKKFQKNRMYFAWILRDINLKKFL